MDSTYKLYVPPAPVGGYKIGEVIYGFTKKPCWLHRKMAKLLLGWEWADFTCGSQHVDTA